MAEIRFRVNHGAGLSSGVFEAANLVGVDADKLDGLDSTAFLKVANNLSDLAAVATARTNLSVYSIAQVDAGFQPLDGELSAIAGLVSAADRLPFFTGAGTAALTGLTAFARTVLDDADAAAVRSTISAQTLDATLTALAALGSGADKLPFFTGVDTAAETTLTAFARTLLDDVDAAGVRGTISAQALDATLTALAALGSGADKLPFFTGVDTAAETTLTSFARTLLDDTGAAAARTTLGAIADIVEDTTPQLGGPLGPNGHFWAGQLKVVGDGDTARLVGISSSFLSFYPDGEAGGRHGLIGFADGTVNNIEITNDTSGYITFFAGGRAAADEKFRLESDGKVKLLGFATEDVWFVNAGSVGATQQDWIEVSVGGVTGYLRVFATK